MDSWGWATRSECVCWGGGWGGGAAVWAVGYERWMERGFCAMEVDGRQGSLEGGWGLLLAACWV
jgi:hypothetical protein